MVKRTHLRTIQLAFGPSFGCYALKHCAKWPNIVKRAKSEDEEHVFLFLISQFTCYCWGNQNLHVCILLTFKVSIRKWSLRNFGFGDSLKVFKWISGENWIKFLSLFCPVCSSQKFSRSQPPYCATDKTLKFEQNLLGLFLICEVSLHINFNDELFYGKTSGFKMYFTSSSFCV